MTGEITLSGLVLPVGGIREKALVVELLAPAEEALAAGGAVGAEDAVADRDPAHVVAGGDHLADELVADHEARLDLHPAVVDVEVRAADPARLDADERVVGREQLGLGDLVDLDLARRLEGDRSHTLEPMRGRSAVRSDQHRSRRAAMGIEKSRPVLITGCSTGIGRATAERLADEGCNVYATARRPESIADLAERGHARPTRSTSPTSARWRPRSPRSRRTGRSARWSTTPATARAARSRRSRWTSVRRQFETNVFGLMRMCQLVLPAMRGAGSGRIVNLSSMGGKLDLPRRRRLPRHQARGRGALGRAALRGPRVRRRRGRSSSRG